MSASVKCVISLDTNAHFASVIHAVNLTIQDSLRNIVPLFSQGDFSALVWFGEGEYFELVNNEIKNFIIYQWSVKSAGLSNLQDLSRTFQAC